MYEIDVFFPEFPAGVHKLCEDDRRILATGEGEPTDSEFFVGHYCYWFMVHGSWFKAMSYEQITMNYFELLIASSTAFARSSKLESSSFFPLRKNDGVELTPNFVPS